jgi:hypothetical protein
VGGRRGNKSITYDVGTITRPITDLSAEQIGLTLEEGQQLLRRVQVEMIGSQADAYALCRRPCVHCGRPKRIKDTRTKSVQTVFGALRSSLFLDYFPLLRRSLLAARSEAQFRRLFNQLNRRIGPEFLFDRGLMVGDCLRVKPHGFCYCFD